MKNIILFPSHSGLIRKSWKLNHMGVLQEDAVYTHEFKEPTEFLQPYVDWNKPADVSRTLHGMSKSVTPHQHLSREAELPQHLVQCHTLLFSRGTFICFFSCTERCLRLPGHPATICAPTVIFWKHMSCICLNTGCHRNILYPITLKIVLQIFFFFFAIVLTWKSAHSPAATSRLINALLSRPFH